MICENCNILYNIKYGSGRFCSSKCARSFSTKNNRKDINIKISLKLKGKIKEHNLKICKLCNNKYYSRNKTSKFCTFKCWKNFTSLNKTEFEKYKLKCKFCFNVYKYPNYFNLQLINEFGWYSPINNYNGISRDHILSVKEGFIYNISPEIISHPANCMLMRHTENQKKKTQSYITLQELKERIIKFEHLNGFKPL